MYKYLLEEAAAESSNAQVTKLEQAYKQYGIDAGLTPIDEHDLNCCDGAYEDALAYADRYDEDDQFDDEDYDPYEDEWEDDDDEDEDL